MCHDASFETQLALFDNYLSEAAIDPQVKAVCQNNPEGYSLAQAHGKAPVMIYEDEQYKIKAFEWGVIAPYMDTPEKVRVMRKSMVNARAEKVLDDKKSIWHRIRKNRCLYLVKSIYEHREIKGWKNKVPYCIRIKGRSMFGVPAFYFYPNVGDIETGEITGTFAIVTRPANDVMKLIHNGGENAFRMPLFLPDKEMELKWLDPDLTDDEMRNFLSFELPSESLEYHTVFTLRTTKERPDGKTGKMEPFTWPNLPPLGVDETNLQLF